MRCSLKLHDTPRISGVEGSSIVVQLFTFIKKTCFFPAVAYLLLSLVSPASAQENFATFPLLPTGYTSIKVFDNQQRYVGRILPEKRYWTTIDRIPLFLQKAVVAVEDARFYEHGGIDVRGIARALVKDVKRRLAEGLNNHPAAD
jgi:membrane peptidoglycan carboxypeptidase